MITPPATVNYSPCSPDFSLKGCSWDSPEKPTAKASTKREAGWGDISPSQPKRARRLNPSPKLDYRSTTVGCSPESSTPSRRAAMETSTGLVEALTIPKFAKSVEVAGRKITYGGQEAKKIRPRNLFAGVTPPIAGPLFGALA